MIAPSSEDEGEHECEETETETETETEDEDEDDRQDKQHSGNEDRDVDESRNSLKKKLAVLEFNCIPALTFHETPHIMPTPVIELSRLMLRVSSGCKSVPESLRPMLETHPRLTSEDFPHFARDHTLMPDTSVPQEREQADLKLWERVQLIVNLTEKLRNTNAEEAAYRSLVRIILEGTPLSQYSSDPVVKVVLV